MGKVSSEYFVILMYEVVSQDKPDFVGLSLQMMWINLSWDLFKLTKSSCSRENDQIICVEMVATLSIFLEACVSLSCVPMPGSITCSFITNAIFSDGIEDLFVKADNVIFWEGDWDINNSRIFCQY